MVNYIDWEWFVLSTRESKPEFLKSVIWYLSAFLIKMSSKESSHWIDKNPTWFAKYYLEVLWSCQRSIPLYDQNPSTQMLSSDTACKVNLHLCHLLLIVQFSCICFIQKIYPLCNELRLTWILKNEIHRRLMSSSISPFTPFSICLQLNYVRPEFSRMRYIGGLCQPRSISL